jgi:NAD(P)-dependent dehydrogenase (short-subunit alcohol dehydrogenase family)
MVAEAAERVAGEIGGEAVHRRVDVSNAQDIESLVVDAVRLWEGLDVMVNNAGVGVAATAPATSEEDWQRVIDVNLKGTFLGMKYAIPAIRDSGGGSVINVASTGALVGIPDRAAYCAPPRAGYWP